MMTIPVPSRREILLGGLATAFALGAAAQAQGAETNDAFARGRALMAGFASVDVHSHAGRFFADRDAASALPSAADRLRGSAIDAVLLSGVADLPLLASGSGGLVPTRPFRKGEALTEYRRQIALLQSIASTPGLRRGERCSDIAARDGGGTAVLFAIEGGDFIEDRLDRIAAARTDGVRAVTIVHYATNQIGDPQTAAPVHDGLSSLGRRIVRELGDSGILVDLSHCSLAATKHAVASSRRPMLLSHTNIGFSGLVHPRLISVDHARVVTEAGGLLGLLPGGAGVTDLAAFIDLIQRSVDALGIDHVGIGTDMDYTFKSVLPDYRHWPLLAAALSDRGYRQDELARILGGNFLRLMAATTGETCGQPLGRPATSILTEPGESHAPD